MTTYAAGDGKQPGRHPSPAPNLTVDQWQYISFLIADDVRKERFAGFRQLAETHRQIWEKIQPLCWDEEDDS